jgi:hypothetical protein
LPQAGGQGQVLPRGSPVAGCCRGVGAELPPILVQLTEEGPGCAHSPHHPRRQRQRCSAATHGASAGHGGAFACRRARALRQIAMRRRDGVSRSASSRGKRAVPPAGGGRVIDHGGVDVAAGPGRRSSQGQPVDTLGAAVQCSAARHTPEILLESTFARRREPPPGDAVSRPARESGRGRNRAGAGPGRVPRIPGEARARRARKFGRELYECRNCTVPVALAWPLKRAARRGAARQSAAGTYKVLQET